MSSRTQRLCIGIETDILRGSMTGVGNYCFHLVKALIENDTSLDFRGFSGVTWRALGMHDLQAIEQAQGKHPDSKDVASRPSVMSGAARSIRKRLEKISPARRLYRKIRAARFDKFPPNMSLDIFHAFKYVPVTDLDVPVLPVVYDLSFIRYPDAHPADRLRQLGSLPGVIERSAIVQTISQFSKAEIVDVYGCSPEKIIVAPPAAAAIFRPLGADVTIAALIPLKLSYKNYLLAVGTLEPRKNLRTLISAYSELPPAMRSRFPLVIAGNPGWGKLNLPPDTNRLISDGSVRFLGSVSDTQLRSLYEGAIGLLFPSIYEGFGMPVVESLACGTQVAHSSDSSMDEITGGTALRASALDVSGWTTIMNTFIEQRAQAGLASDERVLRSEQFNWHRSAAIVRKAYDVIVAGHPARNKT
jgi:glycosyltransferase involved in cell wall biosynthesis